jgi:very-short-patch-repair endonuclease
MTNAAIERRVTSGEWRRMRPSVFLRADRASTSSVHLRAAVYGAGKGAMAFGPSAAWWHGLIDRPPADLWVSIPADRRLRRDDEIHLRSRDLEWMDAANVRHLRVTDLPLTVLEAAVELRDGSVMMDRALQRHTTLPILEAVHERNHGRRGAPAAAKLLRAAGEGGASEAERMLVRLLRRASISGWRQHVRSCGYEIDIAFVNELIAIEVDGWAWHRDVERFNRDAERQNVLVNNGWTVLRFTWHHLTLDAGRVRAEIESALARAA